MLGSLKDTGNQSSSHSLDEGRVQADMTGTEIEWKGISASFLLFILY